MSAPKEMKSAEEWAQQYANERHRYRYDADTDHARAIQADVLEWCMCQFSFYCDAYKLIEQKHAELTKGKE